MNNVQAAVRLQQLHSQINTLDIAISQLMIWYNADKFNTVSIYVSGNDPNDLGKAYHHSVKFDYSLPAPTDHLKRFAENYCQDLIVNRYKLLNEVEELQGQITPGQNL